MGTAVTEEFDTRGIQARLDAFREERGWAPFHDPRSLVLAIATEVGELAEVLAWVPDGEPLDPTRREALADELADVITYGLHLANAIGVDLGGEVERKLTETRDRFAGVASGEPSRRPGGRG